MKPIDISKLTEALTLLNEHLILDDAPATEIVVCGGSALIATGLVPRTTQDVDIVALMKADVLIDSEPLPEYLLEAADRVGKILNLPVDWLNNGPASQFRLGLPPGFAGRLQKYEVGARLSVYFISRLDQVYFKTFASADRGGYHISDLKALRPTDAELQAAAEW